MLSETSSGTVLDLDTAIEANFTSEQMAAVKYREPLYFDFDDIDTVLPKLRQFLNKLTDLGVDLTMCR